MVVLVLRRNPPLERGPKVHNCRRWCAHAENGLKPPFESPHSDFVGPIVARAIRDAIRKRSDSRESFAIETPNFTARQADSHESLEFPIRANHPIRANRFVRITSLSCGVSLHYRAIYVAKWGIAQMCLIETKYQGGGIASFCGAADLPEEVSRDMGYLRQF